jgi:hypothetical protein
MNGELQFFQRKILKEAKLVLHETGKGVVPVAAPALSVYFGPVCVFRSSYEVTFDLERCLPFELFSTRAISS